jgi:hypothetical protein
MLPGGEVRAFRPTDRRRVRLICPAAAGAGPGRWSGRWCGRCIREHTATDRCRELERRKPTLLLRLSGQLLLRVADRQF